MSCWAIIAVNARARCKTRLDEALGLPGRRQLARRMLRHVLRAARGARGLDTVAVVSPERDDLPAHLPLIRDSGLGLNAAAAAALRAARRAGAREVLFLAADLPLLTSAEIESFLERGRRTGFAVATDRSGRGTNALYLNGAVDFLFRYGPDSMVAHCNEGRRLGYEPVVVREPGLASDVDTLSDYCEAFPGRASLLSSSAGMVAG